MGVEEVAALPDPVGRVLATFTRPNGLIIERVATPLGVVGVIYESRPECDRRRRRAVPQERQCGGAPRRLRQFSLVGRDPRLPGRGLEGSRSAGAAITRAPFAAPRGGRRDAGGPRRRARRHRAARGKEPGRAGSARGAGAGVRPSRRRRACLRRSCGGFRQGAEDRRQRQDATHWSLRRGRDAAGASRRRPVPAGQADRRADQGGLRRARRCGGA